MRKAFVWTVAAGFAAMAMLPAQEASAASRHAKVHHTRILHQNRKLKAAAWVPPHPTDPSKDAALIIDGRTGATLYARNEDAIRHPASLTKMMTLYLLFDALKQGKVTMDTPLKVSYHATQQKPTKLYLKKGETIPVETAIKAIVVLSANDVAVTIAENLGGTESKFADMMTEKAHQLGMKDTHYNNASGLPDPGQVTTAADLATLARHVAYDYPQYFHYFSTVSFSWHGTPHITHNNLIGNYEGADGIKTGYTNASGFNLVSSVVRGGEHVIGVVMGGYTARSRDREMERLLDDTFDRAKTNPTLLARAEVPWQQIAANSGGTPVTAGFDVNGAPTSAIAQNNALEISKRWTLLAAMNKAVNPNMKAPKYPDEDEDAAETATAAPVPTAKPVQIANNYPQTLVGAQTDNDNAGEGDVADDQRSTAAAMGARSWAIQIGAYASDAIAHSELSAYARKANDMLKTAQQMVIPVQSANGHTIFRARFGPMAERDARDLCARLTERGQTCFATMSAR
ncbi:MAG TPA: D-alanyl-D-alanine carboxypeptidase [Rhizomicrobium sp.]|nr:D-alanyl-D-alanine carboxypeptidase [Rhizomicrobium sp.]